MLIATVLFLAYVNGANDTLKGVATLLGSGVLSYRKALGWAVVTTLAGSLCALWAAAGLVARFGGRGLVPDALAGTPDLVLAVAAGASVTVLAATLLSLPVSTTHALTGALVGAGWVMASGDVNLASLGKLFFLPLVASPVISLILSWMLQGLACRFGGPCICVSREWAAVTAGPGLAAAAGGSLRITRCREPGLDAALALRSAGWRDRLHVLSAGAVSFARGLNDAPKILALLMAAPALGSSAGPALVAAAMAFGALAHGGRVAATMSRKITDMSPSQGLSANLVTAALVLLASRFSLPVSTTHVSCGTLVGIGLAGGRPRWGMVGTIALAWGLTLPFAALLGAAAARLV